MFLLDALRVAHPASGNGRPASTWHVSAKGIGGGVCQADSQLYIRQSMSDPILHISDFG